MVPPRAHEKSRHAACFRVPLTGQFSNLLMEGLDRLWDVSDIEIVQLFEDKKVRTLWVENDIVRKKIIRLIKE